VPSNANWHQQTARAALALVFGLAALPVLFTPLASAETGAPGLAALAEDPSPLFAGESAPRSPGLERPVPSAVIEHARESPPLRIHVSSAVALADTDLDGIPDRVSAAERAAAATLDFCERIGLGGPLDDGDGELDVYLVDVDGAARGYAVFERHEPAFRRAASGFVVADVSSGWSEAELSGIVARSVARLVLAAHDSTAPLWWTEASALWIESRVAGRPARAGDSALERLSAPEAGPVVADVRLARGNLSLIEALDEPSVEARLIVSTWRALAERSWKEDPLAVVDRAARESTGLPLHGLVERAAVTQLAGGEIPRRWGGEIGLLPVLDAGLTRDVAPGGVALVRLVPQGTGKLPVRLSVSAVDSAWSFSLLVADLDGGWQRVRALGDPRDGLELTLLWSDYREAVLVATRHIDATGPGQPLLTARETSALEPFALSAFGGRMTPRAAVEINWTSAWESGLFGWLVERSGSASGPWESILSIPIPALGLPGDGSSYSVIDPSPAERDASYYRVVGITTLGLRVSGPAFLINTASP
jgi:hypothetical protein